MAYNYNPLEKRPFRYKHAHMEFFCPLCGTQRAMSTNPHLSAKNYFQITLITVVLGAMFYPLMEFYAFFAFFPVWAAFEATLRISFRKEIPCPHCGFDAAWYKTDVKVAKEKVNEFWDGKNLPPNETHTQHTNEEFIPNEAP